MKNFTRILISTSLTLMAINSYSQEVVKTAKVGIGTVSPAQKLEIAGNNTMRIDGFTSGTYDVAPSAGTSNFVYANSSGDLYAMPNGTSGTVLSIGATGIPTWSAIGTLITNAWFTTGNSGTVPGTNYIGTNDDEGLVFKVFNTYAGSVDPLNPGYSAGNVYLGAASTSAPILNGAGNIDAGDNNVAIGLSALGSAGGPSYQGNPSNATGGGAYNSANVAIGVYALSSDVLGNANTAIGAYSQRFSNFAAVAAGFNTSAGAYSMYSNSTGQYNTAFGYYSMHGSGSATAVGNFNTALGYNSLYTSGAGIFSNTAIGSNALYNNAGVAGVGGNRNTAVGDSALWTNTTGYYNTAIGYGADVSANNLNNATVIGYKASALVSNSVTLGNSSVNALYLPGYTAVGDILYTSAGTGLVSALTPGTAGYVLESQGPGFAPTWLSVAGVNSVTATAPIYSTGGATPVISIQGNSLGTDKGGVLYSTGSGTSAAFTSTGTANYVLQSNGTGAPSWVSAPAAANAWNLTGNSILTTYGTNFLGTLNTVTQVPLEFKVSNAYAGLIDASASNIYFGRGTGGDSTVLNTVAGQNVAIGWEAFAKLPSTTAAADVTAIGADALHNNTVSNNDAVGAFALYSNTTGTPNTAYGYAAGYNITTGANNFTAGYNSMYYQTTGTLNVAVGDSAMYGAKSGVAGANYISTANTAMGVNALGALAGTATTGSYNTAIGYESLRNVTTGTYNSAVGYQSGYTNATGYGNVAMGYNSLKSNTASDNVALGTNASLNTIAIGNTAVGDSALYTNTTGTYNTAVGYQANVSSSGLTNATSIGYQASAPVSNSITLGNTSAQLYLPGYANIGDILYTSASNGLVSALVPGPSGSVLESTGSGSAPTWMAVAGANSVSATAPIYTSGPSTTPVISIQGNVLGTDQGGVLYSTGTGTSAVFNSTGTSGQVLQSNGTAAPTWVTPSAASSSWGLTGNPGTTSANFIGTTATEPLVFKVNNVFAGDLDYTTQSVTLGYGAYSEAGTSTNVTTGWQGGGSATIGFEAAYNCTAGTNGTYVGAYAMYSEAAPVTTTGVPVVIGYSSQYYSTGQGISGSVSVGAYSLYSNAAGVNANGQGENETAIGYKSMYGSGTNTGYFGGFNTAVGYQSLLDGTGGAVWSNTAVGSNALYQVANNGSAGVGGNRNTAVGDSALASNTYGEGNTALGYDADVSSNSLTNATVIGYQAIAPASNSVTLGNTAVTALYLPGYTAVGDLLYTSAATGLVSSLAPSATSGFVLTSQGSGAAPTWTSVTGANSVAGTIPIYITGTATAPIVNIQGNVAGTDAGGVLYSTGAGTSAAFTATPSSANLVLVSGAAGAAPTWQAAPAASNSWLITGNASTVAGTNYVGTSSTQPLAFKVNATPAGWIDYAGNLNSYFGYGTGNAANGDYGNSNVAMGVNALANVPTGATVTATEAIGAYTMANATAANGNIAFGAYSQYNNNGYQNTSIGAYSLYSNTGVASATVGSAGINETAIGYQSMYGSGTAGSIGTANTAIGYRSLYSITTGGSNTAVGSNALYNSTAGRNTAVGDSALFTNTTGEFNTAVGYGALTNNVNSTANSAGNYNTALGYNANVNATTNATAIGAFAYASQNNSIVLGGYIGNGNGATANTNVAIGTNVPATDAALTIKTLHIETQVAVSLTSAANTGSGVSAATITGTDVAGNVIFNESGSGAAGTQVTINFANAYTTAPTVIITAGNVATGAIMGSYLPFVGSSSTSGFTISFANSPASSGTLQFNYFVIETQ